MLQWIWTFLILFHVNVVAFVFFFSLLLHGELTLGAEVQLVWTLPNLLTDPYKDICTARCSFPAYGLFCANWRNRLRKVALTAASTGLFILSSKAHWNGISFPRGDRVLYFYYRMSGKCIDSHSTSKFKWLRWERLLDFYTPAIFKTQWWPNAFRTSLLHSNNEMLVLLRVYNPYVGYWLRYTITYLKLQKPPSIWEVL